MAHVLQRKDGMRTFILGFILFGCIGCASSATKAREYCDDNWSTAHYQNWQACYDRELPNQNKGIKALSVMLQGIGTGGSQAQDARAICTQRGPRNYSCDSNGRHWDCFSIGNRVECQ